MIPVILELDEYEAPLVVDALMEGRIKLMKDWGDRYRSEDRSPFEGDLDAIDEDIETVAVVRERLKEAIKACQVRARADRDQASTKVNGWTTLPEGFEITFDETDTWPYAETDPEKKIVVAGADTQADGAKVAFYTYDLNGRCKVESADDAPVRGQEFVDRLVAITKAAHQR